MDGALDDFPAYRQADVRFHIGLAEATGSARARGRDDRGPGRDDRPDRATSPTRPRCWPGPTRQHARLRRPPARARRARARCGSWPSTCAAPSTCSPACCPVDLTSVRATRTFAPPEGSEDQTFSLEGSRWPQTSTDDAQGRRRAAARRARLQAGPAARAGAAFSNFAISFTIISVLAGCFTTYGQAWNNGGPIAISWGWPIICGLILLVAFSHVRARLGVPDRGRHLLVGVASSAARRWGWFTGWFNLVGLVGVVASVDYALRDVPERRCSASTSVDLGVINFGDTAHVARRDVRRSSR